MYRIIIKRQLKTLQMETSYNEFRTDNVTLDLLKPSIMNRKVSKLGDSALNFSSMIKTLDHKFIIVIATAN